MHQTVWTLCLYFWLQEAAKPSNLSYFLWLPLIFTKEKNFHGTLSNLNGIHPRWSLPETVVPLTLLCIIYKLFFLLSRVFSFSPFLCVFSSSFLPTTNTRNYSYTDFKGPVTFRLHFTWFQEAGILGTVWAWLLFMSAYIMCSTAAVSWISNVQLSSCFRPTIGQFPCLYVITWLSRLFRKEISWVTPKY
jgi:hypothetical protein